MAKKATMPDKEVETITATFTPDEARLITEVLMNHSFQVDMKSASALIGLVTGIVKKLTAPTTNLGKNESETPMGEGDR